MVVTKCWLPYLLLATRDKSVILPSERQVILELSHVILGHTHRGMWVYPTAMTAALILQNRTGLEKSETTPLVLSLSPSPSFYI